MGTDRLIYIRTDANSTIATGHMMRCLSVANACLLKGMQVCFVVSDAESKSVFDVLLEDTVSPDYMPFLSVSILQNALYNEPEKELPQLTDMIVTNKADILLLDSYFVTPAYLKALKQVTKIAYIDDLRSFDYDVDLLINYDIIPDTLLNEYKASYQNAGKCLLGGLYTPLRNQFQNHIYMIEELQSVRRSPNILITTGGSDPYHFCLHFLQAAKHLPVTFHVVIGRLSTDKDELVRFCESLKGTTALSDKSLCNVVLHESVSNMASLMAECDFAVSGAGTTLYELCALGVPTVSYTMADNQMVTANAFDSVGAVPYAGDIRPARDFSLRTCDTSYRPEINTEILSHIVAHIEEMTLSSDNYVKRKSAHETMRRLVDTSGALRIAEALFLCTE